MTYAGGGLRLDNSQYLYWRNGANTADVNCLTLNGNGDFRFGYGSGVNSFQFDKPVVINSPNGLQLSGITGIITGGIYRSTVADGVGAVGLSFFTDYTFNGAGAKLFRIADSTAERLTILGNGKVGIGTAAPKASLHVVGIAVFANNAAAITGGLTAGAFYRTGADPDPVCVVH